MAELSVSTNADQFAAVARRYAEVFSIRHPEKGLGQIYRERALNLALKLYKATKDIAPTRAQIAADVIKQGWRIPEKFPDGRLGRGTPDQWSQTTVAALRTARGRKTRARTAEEAAILGQRPTLQQMQTFVIKYRSSHAGFIASGWLGALRDLGGKTDGGRYGHADVKDVDQIEIVNDAPGCIEANQKHNFVAKGIADATADMAEYIATRLSEELKAAA